VSPPPPPPPLIVRRPPSPPSCLQTPQDPPNLATPCLFLNLSTVHSLHTLRMGFIILDPLELYVHVSETPPPHPFSERILPFPPATCETRRSRLGLLSSNFCAMTGSSPFSSRICLEPSPQLCIDFHTCPLSALSNPSLR